MVDRQTEIWIDAQLDRRTDGQTAKQMDGGKDSYIHRRKCGQTDRWIDRLVDEQLDRRRDGQTAKQMDG